MEIIEYNITDVAIAKMQDLYMDLTIKDIEDKEGIESVHSGRMVVKSKRIEVDKKRKAYKADSLAWGRKVDTEAKRIFALLKPIENHLQEQENTITKEKERIQAEKEAAEKALVQKRIDSLLKVDLVMSFFDIAMLSDDEYTTLLDNATKEHQTRQNRLIDERKNREAEVERLEKAREDQEAEAKRLAEIQAKQETEERELKRQREIIAVELAEKERALQVEKDAVEKAKRDVIEAKERAEREAQERIDREAFEKQAKKDAEVQAKKDVDEAEKAREAKEKADREAKEQETKEARFESLKEIGFVYPFDDLGTMSDKQYTEKYKFHLEAWNEKQQAILAEKVEKERIKKEAAEVAEKARKASLAPDKEKLIDLAMTIRQIISPPAIKNEAVKEIVKGVLGELSAISDNIIEQAEAL